MIPISVDALSVNIGCYEKAGLGVKARASGDTGCFHSSCFIGRTGAVLVGSAATETAKRPTMNQPTMSRLLPAAAPAFELRRGVVLWRDIARAPLRRSPTCDVLSSFVPSLRNR